MENIKDMIKEENLILDAEYLNGKSNGRCKEYYGKGKLKRECEYVNGKLMNVLDFDKNGGIVNELHDWNGFIKEKNQKGKISFEIEYANGIIKKLKNYSNNGKLKLKKSI